MQRIIKYKIPAKSEGLTISEYLKSRFYSAKMLTIFRHTDDAILLNDVPVFLNTKIQCGDEVTVIYTENEKSENIVPKNLLFKIVYEDEDILVVDKSADMPVHPSLNNFDNTLANGIAYYFENKGEHLTFRCINRLDRDTSGLLIVAKHRLSAGILSDFMVNREIHREYRALVYGKFDEKSGVIDLPIGREDGSLIKRFVDFKNGENARTNYKVIDEFDDASLLSITLDTGRTHQIRVHMSYLNHPLLGDSLYNSNPGDFKRQALHSYKLEFKHPITLENMSFVSEMPSDICKTHIAVH